MALDIHIDEHGVRHYVQNPLDPSKPVVQTGAITGPIQLADGTTYDVTEHAVETASLEHAGELMHHIGMHHERHGHPHHRSRFADDYDPFQDEFHHTCTDVCGQLKRSVRQQHLDLDDRLRKLGHGRKLGSAAHKALKARLSAAHAHVNRKAR